MGLHPRATTPISLTCEQARLTRPKARTCADPGLWGIIWGKLELRWSPEQFCAYLRMRFPHKSEHEPVRRGRSIEGVSPFVYGD